MLYVVQKSNLYSKKSNLYALYMPYMVQKSTLSDTYIINA
jgi:hypothetical protein